MRGVLLETDTKTVQAERPAVESGFGRKRLTINTLSSLIYFTLLMGIGLWYTPFMLHRVPEHIYGLVPLATSLTSHMVVIMTMITGPVCRYVSADLLRGDIELANSTFNSFVFGGLKIIAILASLVVLFSVILPISVPEGHETSARLLFLAIGLSFLISSMSSCFEVGYWVTHRFEIKSLVDILVLVVRNGSVVALFYFYQPDIWQIAMAAMAAAVFQLVANYGIWKKLAPQLRIDRKAQTPERKALIYSVGRWLIMSHLGNQLLLSTDLLLVNRYFGTIGNTKYGIVLLAATIVRSIFASMGLILVPALVTLESTQSSQQLVAATSRAVRMFGSIAAHATGIIAGLTMPLLTIWIKKPWVPEVAPLSIFILLAVTFEICMIPLTALLIAPERIARYAIASFATGSAAVILAIVLLQTTDLQFYAVAISFCLFAIVKNGLFNPILAARGLNTSWYEFAILGIPIVIRFCMTMLLANTIGNWIEPASPMSLLWCMVLTALISLPLSMMTLPKEDRAIVFRFVIPKFT